MRRALAVSVLLAIVSSSAAGWAVAFHLAIDDDHGSGSSHHDGLLGLDMVLHGHAHGERTPAHEHPLLTSAAAAIPGKLLLLMGSMVGDAPERVATPTLSRRLLLQGGPTHDLAGLREAVTVLRI